MRLKVEDIKRVHGNVDLDLGLESTGVLRSKIKDKIGTLEYHIVDSETPFTVEKYDDLEEINTLAWTILDYIPCKMRKDLLPILEDVTNNDREQMMEIITTRDYDVIEGVSNKKELGEAIVYNYPEYLDVSESVRQFIDFESVGEHFTRYAVPQWIIQGNYAFRIW